MAVPLVLVQGGLHSLMERHLFKLWTENTPLKNLRDSEWHGQIREELCPMIIGDVFGYEITATLVTLV